MKKIYCFNNGGRSGFLLVVALAEDGTCLAQHICSYEKFMAHDLGVTSNWKHEHYDAHYGVGNWELELVPTDQIKSHPGLNTAFAKNQLNHKGNHES